MIETSSRNDILAHFSTVRPLTGCVVRDLVSIRADLFDEAERNAHLGWRAVGGETMKSRMDLTRVQLRSFAGHCFGGIGLEFAFDLQMHADEVLPMGTPFTPPRDRDPAYREAVKSRLIYETERLRRWAPELEPQWGALLQEAAAIGGLGLKLDNPSFPFQLTHHGIRVAFRAPTLAAWIDKTPGRLLEIGGGHGRFIRDCALLLPKTKFVLTDLPLNMLFNARYLTEYFGDSVNLCLLPGHSFAPDARINIVAPWRLGEIDVPVDTACNFLSFQHMDAENLTYYGDIMNALGVDRLFQMNRDTPREDHDLGLDGYPFASAFEALRREIAGTSTIKTIGRDEVVGEAKQIIQLSKRRLDA